MAKSKPEPETEVLDEPVVDVDSVRRGRAHQIWSHSDTGHMLTVEEQLFCRSYIIDRNPVAAMRRIGYGDEVTRDDLKRRADRMLANTEVQGCIADLAKKMMEKLDITADNVNRGMAAIAFFDIREVAEFDHMGVSLLHSKYWTKEQAFAVKSVSMGKDGIKLEIHDRKPALDFLAKQLNLVESESEVARAAAEGAARGAMDKILEITERMRNKAAALPPAEPSGDSEEVLH